MVIHTMTDVRTWAQNCGGLNTAETTTLVEAIRNDGDGQRPAWGRDWSEYLDRIDTAETVLREEVVFLSKKRRFTGSVSIGAAGGKPMLVTTEDDQIVLTTPSEQPFTMSEDEAWCLARQLDLACRRVRRTA